MQHARSRIPIAFLAGLVVGVAAAYAAVRLETRSEKLPSIGATVVATEATTGLAFDGRVDTGAAMTSIHCPADAILIEEVAEDAAKNVGKVATLTLVGDGGRSAQVSARIEGLIGVRNADHTENRYQVRLPLRLGDVERDALVTLNDRSAMRYKLLIGRDMLRDAFVVDVSGDPDDPR